MDNDTQRIADRQPDQPDSILTSFEKTKSISIATTAIGTDFDNLPSLQTDEEREEVSNNNFSIDINKSIIPQTNLPNMSNDGTNHESLTVQDKVESVEDVSSFDSNGISKGRNEEEEKRGKIDSKSCLNQHEDGDQEAIHLDISSNNDTTTTPWINKLKDPFDESPSVILNTPLAQLSKSSTKNILGTILRNTGNYTNNNKLTFSHNSLTTPGQISHNLFEKMRKEQLNMQPMEYESESQSNGIVLGDTQLIEDEENEENGRIEDSFKLSQNFDEKLNIRLEKFEDFKLNDTQVIDSSDRVADTQLIADTQIISSSNGHEYIKDDTADIEIPVTQAGSEPDVQVPDTSERRNSDSNGNVTETIISQQDDEDFLSTNDTDKILDFSKSQRMEIVSDYEEEEEEEETKQDHQDTESDSLMNMGRSKLISSSKDKTTITDQDEEEEEQEDKSIKMFDGIADDSLIKHQLHLKRRHAEETEKSEGSIYMEDNTSNKKFRNNVISPYLPKSLSDLNTPSKTNKKTLLQKLSHFNSPLSVLQKQQQNLHTKSLSSLSSSANCQHQGVSSSPRVVPDSSPAVTKLEYLLKEKDNKRGTSLKSREANIQPEVALGWTSSGKKIEDETTRIIKDKIKINSSPFSNGARNAISSPNGNVTQELTESESEEEQEESMVIDDDKRKKRRSAKLSKLTQSQDTQDTQDIQDTTHAGLQRSEYRKDENSPDVEFEDSKSDEQTARMVYDDSPLTQLSESDDSQKLPHRSEHFSNLVKNLKNKENEKHILRQELKQSLSKEDVKFPNSVWARIENKYYPSLIKEELSCGIDLIFADQVVTLRPENIMSSLDIRIGDKIRILSSNIKSQNFVVTGLSKEKKRDGSGEVDEENIICMRGYDTVYVKSLNKNSKAIDGDEQKYKLSSVFMTSNQWKSRKSGIEIFEENENPLADLLGNISKPIRGRSSGENINIELIPRTPSKKNNNVLYKQSKFVYTSPTKKIPTPNSIASVSSNGSGSNNSGSNGDKIFSDSIFVLTNTNNSSKGISNDNSKSELTRLIQENGGLVLNNGFEEILIKLREPFLSFKLKHPYDKAGYKFAAVISNNYCRSEKYLQGLSLGWPILSESFIHDCIKVKDKRYLFEKWTSYLLPSGYSKKINIVKSYDIFNFKLKLNNFKLPLINQLDNNSNILKNHRILILNNDNMVKPKIVEFLFFALGAKSIDFCNDYKKILEKAREYLEMRQRDNNGSDEDEFFLVYNTKPLEMYNQLSNAYKSLNFISRTSRAKIPSSNNQRKMHNLINNGELVPANHPYDLSGLVLKIVGWEWIVQCVISAYCWEADATWTETLS
ncbi:hypothetical protein PACTADRAFT_2876 [Pachysolen tannophilus NRRL Y-2460]|uniref:BRCT domain-containing protein n=1 Tax=Pachysolen tannophilus NRRL Y-2460 TaxID=669874 RepID=A0A1E4TTV4_PACTA|nr:hypothetical protein PACTADRAFT_2876 [Pachysolen tannophilus NRRL Y-2460]